MNIIFDEKLKKYLKFLTLKFCNYDMLEARNF